MKLTTLTNPPKTQNAGFRSEAGPERPVGSIGIPEDPVVSGVYLLVDRSMGKVARHILLPVNGLVPWHGQVVPIRTRYVEAHGTFYNVNYRGAGGELLSDFNITGAELLAAMVQHARFRVGEKVAIGHFDRYVKGRWWSFRKGIVLYRVSDYHDARHNGHVMPEADLVKQVEAWAAQ